VRRERETAETRALFGAGGGGLGCRQRRRELEEAGLSDRLLLLTAIRLEKQIQTRKKKIWKKTDRAPDPKKQNNHPILAQRAAAEGNQNTHRVLHDLPRPSSHKPTKSGAIPVNESESPKREGERHSGPKKNTGKPYGGREGGNRRGFGHVLTVKGALAGTLSRRIGPTSASCKE